MTRERDDFTRKGLYVLGGVAAVLSFAALSDLARLCGITDTIDVFGLFTLHLAWLLPISIDLFAALATQVAVRRRSHPDALAFANKAMWAAVGATIAGNAYHGWLASDGDWLSRIDDVIVGAVPPLVYAAAVRLAELVAKPSDPDASTAEKAPETPAEPPVPSGALVLAGGALAGLTPELVAQARELMKREPGIGRPRLARELGISEYAARGLLSVLAPTNGHPGGGGS